MKSCFHRTAGALCLLFSLATQANSEPPGAWSRVDLAAPAFDPLLILNPAEDPEAEWARQVEAGNREKAAAAFVTLLREGPARVDLEESIPAIRLRWFGVPINRISSEGFDPDDLVDLRYTGTYGITHQFEDEIDWTHDGSNGQTPEWTWQLNRHFHWIDLADAYRETGDEKYARAWEKELRSWIAQCPRPADSGNRKGSAWRTLDTGIRAGSTWPYAFEIFRHSPEVSDEAVWLIFAAQRENALHLQEYPTGGNWKIMESNGLGHVGFMFPEIREADRFAETAIERIQEEIEKQFYPDGTHQEFAPHYAAAGCLANFYALARIAEQGGSPLPDSFWNTLAHLVSALARIADPEGIAPPVHNSHKIDIKNIYQDIAAGRDPERYGRAPWAQAESDLVPYGGYAVFRRENSYALFDAGPRGTSHFHDDDLQLLTYAHGREFAIDPATPNYTTEPISRHLRSSGAHNVVLLDGRLHKPAVEIHRPRAPAPISFYGRGPVQIGAARRTLLQEERGATFDHERVVLDVDGLGWVVLDRLFPGDDEPHTWEWIWNMAADAVIASGSTATALYPEGPAMTLVCSSNATGEYSVATGQTDPHRGWMNERGLSEYRAIPALRFLTEKQAGAVWAVTLHAPFSDEPDSRSLRFTASQKNGDNWLISANRGADSWQFQLTGDDEIRRIRSWRNGTSLGTIAIGNHTVRKE